MEPVKPGCGVIMLAAALVGLVWANSPWAPVYETLRSVQVGPESLHLRLGLAEWASDGLLVIFFFVAGLELERGNIPGSGTWRILPAGAHGPAATRRSGPNTRSVPEKQVRNPKRWGGRNTAGLDKTERLFNTLNMRSASDLTARARIRDAALARFGTDGIAGTSVRAVAADAGVSPALVVHHFGSKEGLRQACDDHVLDSIRDGGGAATEALGEILQAATPIRRYLARALLDDTPAASALFTEIVERTEAWLANGEEEGWVHASADPRGRAVTYVSWLLAPLVLGAQVGRLLGGDPAETATAVRGARAGLEMLTCGLFADDRWLTAFTGLDQGTKP